MSVNNRWRRYDLLVSPLAMAIAFLLLGVFLVVVALVGAR